MENFEVFHALATQLSGGAHNEKEWVEGAERLVVFHKKHPYSLLNAYAVLATEKFLDVSALEGPVISRVFRADSIKDFYDAKAHIQSLRAEIPWSIDRFLCHRLTLPAPTEHGTPAAIDLFLVKSTGTFQEGSYLYPSFRYQLKTYIKIHHVKN